MYTYMPSLRGSPRTPMMAFTHPTTILMPKENTIINNKLKKKYRDGLREKQQKKGKGFIF